MTADLLLEPSRLRASTLLRDAVQRNRLLSVEGLLERAFAFAFRGLVYPQIWEDPIVDMKAMALEPHHHVVAISSGGCNVLSYLTANPAKITAVDLSPAHVALVKLKLAGLMHVPDWESFYRFFGEAKSRLNIADYDEYLRENVDEPTRTYWESRLPNGRRRLSRFTSNLYRKGALGRFISIGHRLAGVAGVRLDGIVTCETQAEQRAYFEKHMAPLFERRIVRHLCSYRAALFGLGIPPSQYEALSNGEAMAKVLRQRLEKLACDFPIMENYFAWQAFNRAYAPNAAGPLPPYLMQGNFDSLKQRAGRVHMHHASLTDTLAAMPAASADRFVLLDAQDWMKDDQLNELWTAIGYAAKKQARVIFRTAGENSILPGRVNEGLLGQWRYLETLSADLTKQDRSAIYGGFHVYERCN
jgi:S-adenosylmethionine-diacylglycerol 3-amino-3-carboxypropyl transferase